MKIWIWTFSQPAGRGFRRESKLCFASIKTQNKLVFGQAEKNPELRFWVNDSYNECERESTLN